MTDAPPAEAAHPPSEGGVLGRFLFLTWILVVLNASRFLLEDRVAGPAARTWGLVVLLTYAVLYLLPAALPILLLHFTLGRGPGARLLTFLRIPPAWTVRGAAVLLAASVQMVIHADAVVFRMYGFHFNGFVLNLLQTPGGVESMGADSSTTWTAAGLCAVALALEAAAMAVALRNTSFTLAWERRVRTRTVFAALLLWILVSFGERVTYGLSDIKDFRPILRSASAFPAYQPLRMRGFGQSIGIEFADREEIPALREGKGSLHYPLAPLRTAPDAKRWNIVWLVAESWRYDMLDPEIMPETSAFAERCVDFRNHFSGGNGTRMGMFSMFYGLYGQYWFPFLEVRRGPVLLDFLIDGGWQVKPRTSAKFTYPEFDHTVFLRVPNGDLIEGNPDLLGWENDRANVTGLIADLDTWDPAHPRFSFMFFESPHARYFFPEECAIRKPYLEKVNYAALGEEENMPLLFARYVNACRHLDTQFARVIRALEERKLLDSTIVIMTGDHGEEFMERGRWGHHSGFNRYQVGVPLLLHWPGAAPARVEGMTSHLDLPATVLGLLGVENPPSDYSLGVNLAAGGQRDSCMISGWSELAWKGPQSTFVTQMRQSALADAIILGPDDRELQDEAASVVFKKAGPAMGDVLKGLGRFRNKEGSPPKPK